MNPAFQGLITIIVGVGGCVGYFYFSNIFIDKVLFAAKGANASRNINRANMVRPWLFLAPALIALGLYLAYPVIETLRQSLSERVPGAGYNFVGLDNYRQMLNDARFWEAMRNNMVWLVVVPAAATSLGLLVAQLTDQIRWGSIAKSLIFMPMAISFVGAAVIFKLIYDTRPVEQDQIGILNALWLHFDGGLGSLLMLRVLPALIFAAFAGIVGYAVWIILRPVIRNTRARGGLLAVALRLVGSLIGIWLAVLSLISAADVLGASLTYGSPQTWLTIAFWNNFFLMVVLIWIQTGFAMVILSAALRGIPEETVEAAIVDGANPFQVFFQIKVPQIAGTIVVVWTTITLVVLKVFDIVFTMTNGQWETQVLANYMYDKLFRANDWGVGSAAAMVIMLLVSPILIWNVYSARKEMR
ncbi:MAG: sugar ABC transporter permease [Verrucomicrobia bacterium]|nr:sugar ABC transporter permease [Verrucomicrobiota bacterium]